MLRPWTLTISLDHKEKGMPLYQALEQEIRQLIEEGSLHAGDALPGSRELAAQLGVSRKTVVTAMECLIDSGLLERRNRVGLFVSGQSVASAVNEGSSQKTAKPRSPKMPNVRLKIDDGLPDASLAPMTALGRAYRSILNRSSKWNQGDEDEPKGFLHLRETIATAMCYGRKMSVTADDVMISASNQQSVYLIAHALIKRGEAIAVETMPRQSVLGAFEAAGLRVVEIPVDADGMQVDVLAQRLQDDPAIRSVYITPFLQYPTTVTLSQERRQKLVELVQDHSLLLIEDEFDCFFPLSDKRPAPLSSRLPKVNCVYINTAQMVLNATVRVGFVASSAQNIDRMIAYRAWVDSPVNPIVERAVSEVIDSGEVRRYIRAAIPVFSQRLDYISERITQELGWKVRYKRPLGGLAIWIELFEDPAPRLLSKRIQCSVVPLPNGRYGMRIGYASMTKRNVDLLIAALKG